MEQLYHIINSEAEKIASFANEEDRDACIDTLRDLHPEDAWDLVEANTDE